MNGRLLRRLLVASLAAFSFLNHCWGDGDPLSALKPGHPRLLAGNTTWSELRDKRAKDPALARLLSKLESDARAELSRAPVDYKKEGRRLLAVSRSAARRMPS
jgi:hypothetical protein